MRLHLLPERFAVCQMRPTMPVPRWVLALPFYSLTRSADEVSLVVPEEAIDPAWKVEPGWRGLEVEGPLDLSAVGILSSLSVTLAEAGVSVFVVSSYATDYVFVRGAVLSRAITALTLAGHQVHDDVQDPR